MCLHNTAQFEMLYAALWKQRTQTKDCSFIYGLLRYMYFNTT